MNLHSISLSLEDLRSEIALHPDRVNEKGYSGITPLMFACWGSSLEKARFLLQEGASVNMRNNAEATSLHYACRSGNLEMVSLLIDAGADINVVDRTGLSPLLEACKKGKKEVAALLRERGAGQTTSSSKSLSVMAGMNLLSTKESEKQFLQRDIPDHVSDASFVRAQ